MNTLFANDDRLNTRNYNNIGYNGFQRPIPLAHSDSYIEFLPKSLTYMQIIRDYQYF